FIDIGCILVILGRTACEKIHLVGKDFAAIAFDAFTIIPLGIVDTVFYRHHLALGAILGNILAQPVEAGDAVKFCIIGGKAVFILVGLAILVAGGSVGHHRKICNRSTAVCCPAFRIAGNAANQKRDICHDILL